MSIEVNACDLHFPHKEWSDDVLERQNYLEVERWARHFHTGCPEGPEGTFVTIRQTGCDLHIPHKEWAGDERERQNYLEMERWAKYFRLHCCAGGRGGTGGGLPESPPILVAPLYHGPKYAEAILGLPVTLEDNISFEGPSFFEPGITWDMPNGYPLSVIPYIYGSFYQFHACRFTFPPCRNVRIHLQATFSEGTAGAASGDSITRGLHIWVQNGPLSAAAPTGVDYAHVYGNYVGTRASTVCQLDAGPYDDIPGVFTIHVYCLWNSVADAGTTNLNHLNYPSGSDSLVVTGELV